MKYLYCIFFVLAHWSVLAFGQERVLYEAEYEGKISGLSVNMTRQLFIVADGSYLFRAKAKSFLGAIEETEAFSWSPELGIQPLSYRYKQRIFGITKQRSIDFDWTQKKAMTLYKDEEKVISIDAGVLGPMSARLMLQMDLLHGGDKLHYQLVNRNALKYYEFGVGESQGFRYKNTVIKNALPVSRSREGSQRKTLLLFNIDNNFDLVSIEQHKEDSVSTLSLVGSAYYPPFENTPLHILSKGK